MLYYYDEDMQTWNIQKRNANAEEYSKSCKKKRLEKIYNRVTNVVMTLTLGYVAFVFVAMLIVQA